MKTKTTSRYATKILALVLSLLMLLGAMPVALAAEGDIVTKWPTAAHEIEYGQTDSDAGLNNDGETTVPGTFEFVYPTGKPGVGIVARKVKFIPTDTTIAPVEGTVDVTVHQSKSAKLEGGVPTASAIKVGQKLSDSVITKTGIKFTNYGTAVTNWKCRWKEPDKVMNTAGIYTETIECYPGLSSYQKKIASIWIDIEIVVEAGEVEYAAEVTELPVASNIKLGQTLADSVLTGGKVMKGDVEIPGTFAWKDPADVPTVANTLKRTVVFTPTNPTDCDPIEAQVEITVEKLDVEITWPEAKGHYKAGGYVDGCVTLTGGKANIEGNFGIILADQSKKIPESIADTMDITLFFIPKDKVNYEEARKTVTVTFEPAVPILRALGERDYFDHRQINVNCWIAPEENWEKHTGNFYMVLDGERTELTKADNAFSYTDLTPGEHTVYCVYEAGANDVYTDGQSEETTFTVTGFYNVNVTDYTGTYVLGNYEAGSQGISVTAPVHEKPYYDFTGWTAEGVELTEEEKAQERISFTMPENEVNLTANYKFNFKSFIKWFFNQIGIKLMALVQQGIEWIKGLRP